MKKILFTICFFAAFLSVSSAQIVQAVVNPGVYDSSVFNSLYSNQAFRNKFNAVIEGPDTVTYFVDLYGVKSLKFAQTSDSSGGSGVNIYNSDGTILSSVNRTVSMEPISQLNFNFANGNQGVKIYAGDNVSATNGEIEISSPTTNNSIQINENGIGLEISDGADLQNNLDFFPNYLQANTQDNASNINSNFNVGTTVGLLFEISAPDADENANFSVSANTVSLEVDNTAANTNNSMQYIFDAFSNVIAGPSDRNEFTQSLSENLMNIEDNSNNVFNWQVGAIQSNMSFDNTIVSSSFDFEAETFRAALDNSTIEMQLDNVEINAGSNSVFVFTDSSTFSHKAAYANFFDPATLNDNPLSFAPLGWVKDSAYIKAFTATPGGLGNVSITEGDRVWSVDNIDISPVQTVGSSDGSILPVLGPAGALDLTVDASQVLAADNGTNVSGGMVKLGGPLTQSTTTITADNGEQIVIAGTQNASLFANLDVQNTGTNGNAINASATSGRAIYATATNGNALEVGSSAGGVGIVASSTASGGIAITAASGDSETMILNSTTGITTKITQNHSSTNTVTTIAQFLRHCSGSVADNIGQSVQYYVEGSGGGTILSSEWITQLIDITASTETSRVRIRAKGAGVDRDVLQLYGTGTVNVPAGDLTLQTGSLDIQAAGSKIKIATGANASVGTSASMTAGTITINTTAVTTNSLIFLTHKTFGGTTGVLRPDNIVNGTSFDIVSSSNTDTGTVQWFIIN